MDEKEIISLIEAAIEARNNAYTPYSNFKVGAVLKDANNKLYVGVNIENGSFGLTNCAERSAIFTAISKGVKEFKAIAIVADTTGPVSPCGACRQVMSEFFDQNTLIIIANTKMEYKVTTIDELLPYKFKL